MNLPPTSSPTQRPRIKFQIAVVVALAMVYLAAFIALEAGHNAFDQLGLVAMHLPWVLFASLVAYLLRAIRWQWMLARQDHPVAFPISFVSYLAGFSLTASPGKAGELIRIRYFGTLGVPASVVLACFVLERGFDLLVLLVLSALVWDSAQGVYVALAFVVLLGTSLVIAARNPRIGVWFLVRARSLGLGLVARIIKIMIIGLKRSAAIATPFNLCVICGLGLLAWLIQIAGFAVMMGAVGIDLPFGTLLGIPPLAMLVGAASMVPGGLGTTEIATVVILGGYDIELALAAQVAIAMRAGSIWFAMLIGISAVIFLEHRLTSSARLNVDPDSVQTRRSIPVE